MIIRTKGGVFKAESASALLDFLGVKKGAAGPQGVKADVELIASVPFALAAEPQPRPKAEGPPFDGEAGDGMPWTLSTFDLDRYSERIDPAGWEFKRYIDNPVVEWAHRYDIPAIGKIGRLTADDEGLHGLVYFNDKSYDPFGWAIGERVKAGVIRAGSVGFRIIEIEIPDKEMAKDDTSLIFRKQELLEFSICNVPANPFALAKLMGEAKTDTTRDLSRPAFWGGLINTL
jgi:HK97 family phage prohead protease